MLVNEFNLNKYVSESQTYRDINIDKKTDDFAVLNLNKKVLPESRNLMNNGYRKLNENLANLYQYIHLHNSLLNNVVLPAVVNSNKLNKNSFLRFKDELKKIELDLFKAKLKHRYITSKVYVVNNFDDSNLNIIDPKINISMPINQICNGKDRTLSLNEIRNHEILCKNIFFDFSKMNCEVWNHNDLKNIVIEDKNFRCIVRKKRTNVFSNYEIVNSSAVISVVFDFKNKRKVNNLRIQENSIHKFLIEKDDIEFLNSNNEFESITNSSEYMDSELIFFPTIETSKIRITFKQLAFIDIEKDISDGSLDIFFKQSENDTYYYYYDMSLSQIDFFYSIYESQGIYRSSEIYSFKKPLSISFEESYLYESENTFAEKYLNVTLYGDKDTMFLNENGVMVRDFNRAKPSYIGVIPITNDYYYTEILIPSFVKGDETYCKLTFVPLVESVLLNEMRTNVFNKNFDVVESVDDLKCGNYYVKITGYSYLEEYKVSYFIYNEKNLILNDLNFELEDGTIKIPFEFQESIGFLQPIIVLRNKSIYNDDTCVIKNYAIAIEEKENTDNTVVYEIDKGYQQ